MILPEPLKGSLQHPHLPWTLPKPPGLLGYKALVEGHCLPLALSLLNVIEHHIEAEGQHVGQASPKGDRCCLKIRGPQKHGAKVQNEAFSPL